MDRGASSNLLTDGKGQLKAVTDRDHRALESYVYDPAGNLLEKTLGETTTRYEYDAANQLVKQIDDAGGAAEKVTEFAYDAAGRMIREGKREYRYGGLDKVMQVLDDGETVAEFAYGADGQLSGITRQNGHNERLYWSGLALVRRDRISGAAQDGATDDGTTPKSAGRRVSEFYLNEPHPTGGNPVAMWTNDNPAGREMSVAAATRLLFNDMLGSTLAYLDGEEVTPTEVTLFGETANEAQEKQIFFTGKPRIDELGYAFLFRNYRPEKSKWQTADPLGYPDGWNCMAYCGNHSFGAIDPDGALWSWGAAAIGAAISGAGYFASCAVTNESPTVAGFSGALAGGFVAGAIAGSVTGDPSALVGAGIAAAAAASGQLTNNVVSTALDPNKEFSVVTITDNIFSTTMIGLISPVAGRIFPDYFTGKLGYVTDFEIGNGAEFLKYAIDRITAALDDLDQIIKERWLKTGEMMYEKCE